MMDAIEARGLTKAYVDTVALAGLDIVAPTGTVLAMLGPNGAGKTTAVRILATLLMADSGTARVAGFDVRTQPNEVRQRIALTGQFTAVDERLTGRENLELFGRLAHLDRTDVRRCAGELLERLELTNAAAKPVQTYSGGMRRRLDLAAALLPQPDVLFLDEPTTGLDPRSRLTVWELIEGLITEGTTVLLTTQYLDEADRLADEILVVDHGTAIARGTSVELKSRVGGERLVVTVGPGDDLAAAARLLRPIGTGEATFEPSLRLIGVPVRRAPGLVADAVRRLDDAGIDVDDIELRTPTMDDVFLTLTGHLAEPVEPGAKTEAAA
jgi:ABC-2 type transport system ATP-binding protein